MNLGRFYAIAGILVALELALSAWGLALVGATATVPIHWSVSGEPDGYAPAWVAFLVGPVVTAAIVGLMALIPRIEPRRENLRRSANAYRTIALAVVVFMGVIHAVTVLSGVGVDVPVGVVVGGGVGVVFVIIGNVLTTVRSTFLFGVRTPWTLSSERAWDRTHRLVGRLFVVTGIAMAVTALTGQLQLVFAVMLAMLAGTLVVGTWYSFRVWRDDPDRHPIGDPR